jgi:hypothetical protein
MGHRIRLFVPAAFLIVVTCIPALSVLAIQETEVPPQLQPPVDEQLLLQLHAKGDQIYACKSESAQFKAPAATPTMSIRKSASPTPPTIFSTAQNEFVQAFPVRVA